MEKKIIVEVNGKSVKIQEHLLSDMLKLGASQTKKVIVNTPKELIRKVEHPVEVLPEMKTTEEPKKVTRKPRTK